jgi:hypothetical protein
MDDQVVMFAKEVSLGLDGADEPGFWVKPVEMSLCIWPGLKAGQ